MSNPVLCAVDISNKDSDLNVIRRAAQLADLDSAQLDVITVIPDFGMSIVSGYFDASHKEAALEHARTELKRVVDSALGEAAANVRHLVAVGSVYEEILQVADTDNAALIVIGAHKPDFKDYLLGPNAARVVRHASTSVYVVR